VTGSALVTDFRSGFGHGYTAIVRESEPSGMGLDFGIRVMRESDTLEESHPKESVWVLLQGAARVETLRESIALRRGSLFDECPSTLHVGKDTPVRVAAIEHCEWAVARATNAGVLSPRVFLPEECAREERGKGLAQGACTREVRLVFDRESRPESNLVVGEVVSRAGTWSSYPPHHHPQPEIYHYRFTLPQGFGHAELGEEVFKVRSCDTLKISGGLSHAQVAAPGYAMYYLWIVRHLVGLPYTGFEYDPEHTWLLDAKQQGWQPALRSP
jgi:5-deoxy-glucuronate isomerase